MVRIADDSVVAGISNHELFWQTEGMWRVLELGRLYGQAIRDIARFSAVVAQAEGVKVLAQPAVLVRVQHGKGFFLIDQILWDEDVGAPPLASRIGSLLLTNLGAQFPAPNARKIAEADCVFIDLASSANASLRDEKSGDGVGGWTDQGENDLRELPLGKQTLGGVPFHVRDACLVLHSPEHAAMRPKRIEGIAVGRALREIHFLHAAAWGGRPGQRIACYVVHYADGSEHRIPVTYGTSVVDWWHESPRDLTGAALAWHGKNPVHTPVSVYRMAWTNPRPRVAVKSVDIVSEGTDTIPIVIAITGVKHE